MHDRNAHHKPDPRIRTVENLASLGLQIARIDVSQKVKLANNAAKRITSRKSVGNQNLITKKTPVLILRQSFFRIVRIKQTIRYKLSLIKCSISNANLSMIFRMITWLPASQVPPYKLNHETQQSR